MEEKRYLKRKEKAFTDGNQELLAQCCNNLGDFYNQQGKYHNAVTEYEQEAAIYGKLGLKLEMAKAHRMVGEMFMLLCEFENAQNHINVYLKTVKKLQNQVEEQRAYATLGRAHLLHGQSASDSVSGLGSLKNAERAFIRSLLLSKELSGQVTKLEQLDMQARCYLNIGVVKEHIEEFEESIAYIEKAIKICKSNDIFELTHLCYISMSLLYHNKKKDSTLALRYCNLAQEVAKRLPNKVKKICETLIIKAEILIKEGDFASAKQILTKAYKKNTPDENDRKSIEKTLRIIVKICQTLDELVTTSSIDYKHRRKLFEMLGDGCCHLQNYSRAIEYYLQMLDCAELNSECDKDLINIYVSLYQTYKDDKQYDKALEYLWKEYDLNKNVPPEAFSTLCSIGEICEMQMQPFWTVQDVYQKALEQANKAGDTCKRKLEKIAYARLRKLQLKFKMNTLAEQLLEEANAKGINLNTMDDESDNESEPSSNNDMNTPEMGDDVCLDDLTDSDSSDLDESEKPRNRKRGTCLTIKRNNKGETQLHQACIAGNLELVRRLIDQGHVVNVRDHAGWIPLHEACNHGYKDIVEVLLDKGAAAAINDKGGTSCDGITPLYDACSNGYLDVVELLLERGADVTVKTDFGDTCLNILDKWRKDATLNDGEQAQYAAVRETIQRRLKKTGICGKTGVPLTNSHNFVASEVMDEDDDNCLLSKSDEEAEHISLRKKSSRSRLSNHNSSPKEDGAKVLKDCNAFATAKTPTAKEEYKSVMDNLKRPYRTTSSNHQSAMNSLAKKRSALLDSEEVDDDTWLDDDLAPDKKKRRCQSAVVEMSPSRPYPTSTSKENWNDSAISWEIEEPDAFQVLLDASSNVNNRRKQAAKLKLPRSSSISSNASTSSGNGGIRGKHSAKNQSSLLDSGFCRFRSESPMSSEESTDANAMRTTEPDSTTSSYQQIIVSPIKSTIVPSTISFKIKVEEELLLVPIERKKLNEVKIHWLAEEAARRYYNLVGLKPVLRLKTADGFAFEENDTINVALEENMISATVLEWKISPLGQRYDEMCHQLKRTINTDVRDVLEKGQLSNSINFNDFWLTTDLTEPIFKAILHQTNLRILDLSNNFIQNDGCKQLSKSLHTLKQLKVLNLQGNCITCDGVEALTTASSLQLNELEELNLSQNPLGNTSVRHLDKFCSACKTLRKLYLAQCGLTNFYDFDLNFFQLTDFDVSFNLLSMESMRKLLTKLNSCRLQNLNFSFTQTPNHESTELSLTADHIAEFFESGTCEKFKRIDLAGCHLSDANVYKFVQCLKRASELEVLNISDNSKLSSSALQYIIDQVSQLRKLLAVNCDRLINIDRLEHLSESKSVPNFMSLSLTDVSIDADRFDRERRLKNFWDAHWGDRGKLKFYETNVMLYVNEQDLQSL